MSFAVGAALLVGLLVALPAIAHLLRRGRAREQPFPPASLVPAARTVARRERRIEDRVLLAVRALSVLLLAVLGATPLVQCSRLTLARGSGGTVALALVIDDSLSMRAVPSGTQSRFEQAVGAARELLDSAREGDAVAIVLAGKPARLALGSTTNLALARRTLEELAPSDRSTDLGAAVALARSALDDPARRDRQLVVLSDLADDLPTNGEPTPWTPLAALTSPAPDCGIASAEHHEESVRVTLACNDVAAAKGRSVELVTLAGSGVEPGSRQGAGAARKLDALGKLALEPRVGAQTVTIAAGKRKEPLAVRLSGTDRLLEDDVAPVAPEADALRVAVLGSSAEREGPTGGPPLLEQAVAALQAGVTVQPIAVLPDQASELATYALVLLDDPTGFGPEARESLTTHVEAGAVAAAFLGPRVETTKLGSTLEPFAQGSVRWEREPTVRGVDTKSLSWLGVEAESLANLELRGHALIDAGRAKGARVLGTMTDGTPFVVERMLGRGRLFTVTLPTSLDESDLAVRPGFVAWLSHLVETAQKSRGVRRSVAGEAWRFQADRPRIVGPDGPLETRDGGDQGRLATPGVRGLYRVATDRGEELRTVTVDVRELTAQPQKAPPGFAKAPARAGSGAVDVSAETALILLAILGLELGIRVLRGLRSPRRRPVDSPGAVS
jgi:hypothetical protein